MGIETLLRPSLVPCSRQPKVKPDVLAKVGWKGSNFQIFRQDRLHADLKSAFRRTVAYPSYRCFYQEHGTEVVQVVADETVLNPVFTGDSEEANQSIFPLENEAVVEVLLPTMQVQSLEEQEKLAATPAHPEGLYALFGSYFASCLVEHTWRFAWPAVIAVMHHTLLPVAVVSFVSQVGSPTFQRIEAGA
jgi:hypothetical protein